LEIGSIFKDKKNKNGTSITDLEILVTKLLIRNLKGLVRQLKPVELWDKG
jgi:hypothetical protein